MKVAIITQYYKSKNYGGNLQAYAMCKAVEKCGHTAEQLCFPLKLKKIQKVSVQKNKQTLKDVKIAIHVFIYNILISNRSYKAHKISQKREKAILSFNQSIIPHSKECYDESNIEDSAKKYDVFITGSDMVWSPDLFSNIFSLDFVPETTPKFSYAPSMGVTGLKDDECEIYRDFLKNYQAVSVRESNAISILEDLSPVPVEWVLDPTLILEREEWDEICNDRIVDEPYLFCYFLGNNTKSRRTAMEYAKSRKLKIVTIPHLFGEYRSCDWKFGDIQLAKVSPSDFISLIRYSEAVFTDSFHACVFAFLYQRDMFAFRRNIGDRWGVRIYSFLELIGCLPHYCDTDKKESMEYIDSLSKIDYTSFFENLENMKKKSLEYLERNLKKAEEKIKENE